MNRKPKSSKNTGIWEKAAGVDILNEEHHRIYGRQWCLGLDHYQFMVDLGMRPDSAVLDLGCGAGRSGIHFIDYLERGRYVGVDGSHERIHAFTEYELKLNRLEGKLPEIRVHDFVTQPLNFHRTFDFIFSHSVWNHVKRMDVLAEIAGRHLNKAGLLVLSHVEGKDVLKDLRGIECVRDEVRRSILLPEAFTHWTVFRQMA